jgi:tetratricopeptide (TPR) repeat protein
MSDRRRSPAAAAGLVLALAVAAIIAPTLGGGREAWAQGDTRIKAREHYAAGRALYDNGEYEGAIREFAAADALAPSGVNDFNIALCHERLGAAGLAVQFYRSYLNRVPDAANKGEVQASIGRLEKVAAEQKKAEAAAKKKADADAKKAAAEAAKAEKLAAAEAKKAAEAEAAKATLSEAEARKLAAAEADAAAKRAAPDEAARKAAEVEAAKRPAEPAPAAPPAAAPAPATGDPELDRAAAVDVGAIRAQRRGPATAAPQTPGEPTAAAGPATQAPSPYPPVAPAAPERPQPPAAKPVYKKWWFWAVVGVSAVVVISMLDNDDDSSGLRATPDAAPVSGVPLFRF